MHKRTKNNADTRQEIAIVKNSGKKFDKMLETKKHMLADGRINKTSSQRFFDIFNSPTIFLSIFKFKKLVIIKHIPNAQIREFMPIIAGKNQIEIKSRIAPKI